MQKVILSLVFLFVFVQNCFAVDEIIKKDPKLITIENTKPLKASKFNKKITIDNKKYSKNSKDLSSEQIVLYKIFDKLIRANNLQYQNWRIGLKVDLEQINAHSGSVNLILINSALYDSLSYDEDLLSFIISHELAHLILGHAQKFQENNLKIEKLQKELQYYKNLKAKSEIINISNLEVKNEEYEKIFSKINKKIDLIFEQQRNLENEADIEALTLLLRAGFNPEKSIEVLEFLANATETYSKRSTHPKIEDRIKNIENELGLVNVENIKKQGQINLFNCEVLSIQKSIDEKTIVLKKLNNYPKTIYISKTKDEKLNEKAYVDYLNNEFLKAKDGFEKAYEINSKNYISALYSSYISEYQYKENNDKTYLKQARKWIKRASRIKPDEENIQKQKEEIITMLKLLENKKK